MTGSEHQTNDGGWLGSAPGVALLLVAVPFIAVLVGWVGDSWLTVGDVASIELRTAAVGTRETPLVGPYSTRGWAHPGPALYWLAAPLHRASGGDPRSLLVTAALVNLVAIAGVVVLCWRVRGRGLAVAATLALALVARGLGPDRIVDIWNPYLLVFPLTLCIASAWAVANDHCGAAVPGLVVGSFLAQTHVGMVPVVAVIALWTVAAAAVGRRRTAVDGAPPRAEPRSRTVLGVGVGLAALAWVPPLIDQVWGTGNLRTLVGYFTNDTDTVGLRRGAGLVARHVRPDGPWAGGSEPHQFAVVIGSNPAVLAAVLCALAALVVVAHRGGHRHVVLGTTLALTLVVVSVPLASNLLEPVNSYLVVWLRTVGAWSWLWLTWGTWVVVRDRLPAMIASRVAPGAVLLVLAVVTVGSVPAATDQRLPAAREAAVVRALRHDLRATLPRDVPIRIESRGDLFGHIGPGLIAHLREDGFAIVTLDGVAGQKYGPDAIWAPGDRPRDEVLTVAVTYPLGFEDRRRECLDSGARVVAEADLLDADERARMEDLARLRYVAPDDVSDDEQAELDALVDRGIIATVFAAPAVCAAGP